jgi:hypothetical protein
MDINFENALTRKFVSLTFMKWGVRIQCIALWVGNSEGECVFR